MLSRTPSMRPTSSLPSGVAPAIMTQQALRVVLQAGLHVDAVGQEVRSVGGEVALAPACGGRPTRRPPEPTNGRGREPADVLAKQSQECLLEVAGRDALEVEDRNRAPRGSSSPRIGRKIADENRMRSEPLPTRSRTRGQRTATGPMPVTISRSGRCPWRTSRCRPSSVSWSAWRLSKAATSASTACESSARAPLRRTSVSGWKMSLAGKVGKRDYWPRRITLGGEVGAFEHPTIRRLTLSCRHQLSPIAPALVGCSRADQRHARGTLSRRAAASSQGLAGQCRRCTALLPNAAYLVPAFGIRPTPRNPRDARVNSSRSVICPWPDHGPNRTR